MSTSSTHCHLYFRLKNASAPLVYTLKSQQQFIPRPSVVLFLAETCLFTFVYGKFPNDLSSPLSVPSQQFLTFIFPPSPRLSTRILVRTCCSCFGRIRLYTFCLNVLPECTHLLQNTTIATLPIMETCPFWRPLSSEVFRTLALAVGAAP